MEKPAGSLSWYRCRGKCQQAEEQLEASGENKSSHAEVHARNFEDIYSELHVVSNSTVPPTHWTHLGDAGLVRLVVELRDIVVDVLDRDDELGLRLLWLPAPAVDGLSLKDIGSFLLPIELPQHPDLSGVLVDLEGLAGSFSGQDIPDGRVSPVRV